MQCRICKENTEEIFNLGDTPPANSLMSSSLETQQSYPLVLDLCPKCHNVQLRDCISEEELYKNYFYVTPDSPMLHKHYKYLNNYLKASNYINKNSFALEVGSNIGLFLDFIKPEVSKVLGIDPAENICKMAIESGVDTICDFFDKDSAYKIEEEYGKPDIIIARHCFAHNSDPHILMKGVTNLLSAEGCVVIENAYILNTIESNEFDQVYHEHMFYYSIRSMMFLLEMNGLKLIDVLISLVHGGSIIFVASHSSSKHQINKSVAQYLSREQLFLTNQAYRNFSENSYKIRDQIKLLIEKIKNEGKTIYTYGATAKGNTLLNFLEITNKEIPFCVDSTKIKHGKYLPKSNIKIISEDDASLNPPDYFLLTAWNYQDEIINKTRSSGNYSSKFIVPFPFVHVV
jgi:SAM-dependent methyltransferase